MQPSQLLTGHPVVTEKRKQLIQQIKTLKNQGIQPHLKIIRIEGNHASQAYSKSIQNMMEKVGGLATEKLFPEVVSETEFLAEVAKLNGDHRIHGMIVMQPLPQQINRQKVADQIAPLKDVDGMTTINLGRITENNQKAMLPSTAKAVIEILDHYQIDVAGLDVCVIGRSHTVGKPLSLLLLNRDATVTCCHRSTRYLKRHTQSADLVIAAAGVAGLITKEHIRPGAVVIDVGYNFKEGRVVGDVAFDEVVGIAKAITPVPKGVGSVTTISLIEQVVKGCLLQNGWAANAD